MDFKKRGVNFLAKSVVVLSVLIGVGLIFSFSHRTQAASDTPASNASSAALGPITAPPQQVVAASCSNTYTQRFMAQWNSMIKSTSGVVNPNGYLKVIGSDLLPYHSVETFMIEAPDQGHEFSSETLSYMLWLNARYGEYTGDFSYYQNTWGVIEKYAIPSSTDQPNGGTPSATYAGEFSDPSLYPAALDSSVPSGTDPFLSELQSTYGTRAIYGMHWIFDGDNFYGFGNHNDGTSSPAYMNTFQRGPQESTWETIPQPSWDNEVWGEWNGSSYAGFGPYFVGGLSGAAKKYSYTDAPDADARSVQVAYWANQWASSYGVSLSTQNAKAAKLGDFLRYAMAEKYFKDLSCTPVTKSCPGGTGKTMLHYLMAWYYAWGGDASGSASWSWRIGDYAAHFGYQNPMTAYVLSTQSAFKPLSPTASTDWGTSLGRQLDFYQWLQSNEGAIAGGAEFGQVSSSGSYTTAPSGTPSFNNMTYVANPVYLDPGSNTWFGFQAWSMERMAEYYYVTGNSQAASILAKWVSWVESSVFKFTTGTNGEDVQVASTISWSGAPAASFTSGSSHPGSNSGLHVTVVNYGSDMGTMASAAQALTWYAAATQKWGTLNSTAQALAKRVLDDQWNNHRDSTGVTAPEARSDYSRFLNQVVYFPSGSSGRTPKCGLHSTPTNCLIPGATFAQIRPQYQDDPDYSRVVSAVNAGTAPVFTYHRFWAQTDVAVANAAYGDFFGGCGPTPTPGPSSTPAPATKTPTFVPPTKTNTPGGPTATKTNTPNGPTPTKTATPVATTVKTNTPVPTTVKTNTPVPTSSGGTCTPTSTITAPFTFDGAGTFCWKTNSLGSYVNDWNLNSLTINGVNETNLYVASNAYPPKASDGYWYIAYNSSVSYGHFETK